MGSQKKLELSRETLRSLTAGELMDVRGGENLSFNTCLDCKTTALLSPTLIGKDCYPPG